MNEMEYQMLRIRLVEEEIAKRYKQGKMRCPVHLSIGQEAAAVGIASALGSNDKMVSTHRGHAHYLAKGGSLKGLISELYGKSTGCSRGNGGSMHLIDLNCNFWGSTSIVAGTVPIGVGLAFADRLKKTAGWTATTVICIGDAAIEEGIFHEAANFAALHKLNVIFACENNQFSCYTHISERQPFRHGATLKRVAEAHSLSYFQASENVEHICEAIKWGKNFFPAFVEIPTWRKLQHCGPDNDDDLNYRDQRDIEEWKKNDPLNKIEHTAAGLFEIQREINMAFNHAEESPYPEHEAGKYVYAPFDI